MDPVTPIAIGCSHATLSTGDGQVASSDGRCSGLRRHQYHHLPGISLERTTGFEPATLTLAKKKVIAPRLPTCTFTNHAAWSAFSVDRNRPLSTVVVNGACVFCAARTTDSCTTCTTESP